MEQMDIYRSTIVEIPPMETLTHQLHVCSMIVAAITGVFYYIYRFGRPHRYRWLPTQTI